MDQWPCLIKWSDIFKMADLDSKLLPLTLRPVLFLLCYILSHLNPFMQFWGEGVHQNSLSLRMADLCLLGIWSCFSRKSWYLSLFILISQWIGECFVKLFSKKSGLCHELSCYCNKKLCWPSVYCSRLSMLPTETSHVHGKCFWHV